MTQTANMVKSNKFRYLQKYARLSKLEFASGILKTIRNTKTIKTGQNCIF